jgi:ATP-binding cassette subfamily B (MDR/TAP) protein 1
MPTLLFTGWNMMQTVVLKDKKNKEAHEESARLACEAAAAVKTVASLTREQGFVDAYSRSLGEPLRVANRSTMVRMFWFGCTQSTVFLVNALVSIRPILNLGPRSQYHSQVFWYGARLVADLEYSTFQFFVVLMSVTFGGYVEATR